MKKNGIIRICILFTLILTSYFVSSQTSVYRPFPVNYGNWVYKYYDDFHFPTSIYTQYGITGDTTFLSTNYKKIYMNSHYEGAIRESGKIIYFVPDTSTTEYVLYNFNLNQGDTIIHPYGGAVCTNDTVTILWTDSVLCSDGYHRTLTLSSGAAWIEGIGSWVYLLQPCNSLCVSGNDVLQCMESDLTFTFPVNMSSCNVSVSELNNSTDKITVYPNPSNGTFSINTDLTEVSEIYITSLLGKIVYQKQSDLKSKISINNLDNGTYILTTVDKFNNKSHCKILISR